MTSKDNFKYLTFSLASLLLSMALAQQFFDASAQRLVQSITVITLLAVVWGAKDNHHLFRRVAVLPFAIVATSLISYILDNANLSLVYLLLLLIFFVLTAFQTAKQVLFSGHVDVNKILGAICLYMLMGLIWAVMYTFVELQMGHSFKGIASSEFWFELLPTFVYFSFVTLTTLGYGDISPTTPLTQYLVYIEALIGQFYLTILVASLVGSHLSYQHRRFQQNDAKAKESETSNSATGAPENKVARNQKIEHK